ncbi:copper amine oxidase N-terminal domain-containing protein [Paenibacillus daejeonensis]|uniref:copper amine oxidase N-terminal domain-containing protein n=1 Tax=Paenibacillus daejeonensis TaxID=135193 RepID=UPI00036A09F1|nr:copper amine oxidase N-terminal domain-containing protein [Paenibacillus daejeonensis]
MMKKLMVTVLAGAMMMTMAPAPTTQANSTKIVRADMPLEVLYNARKIVFDVKPKMVNGTVLVPIRFVSDKLGGQLTVNGKDITIVKGNRTLKLTMNSRAASFNGTAVTLNQPAMVERGRTLVPLRAVSEGLGTPVEWDGVNQFVWIGHKEIPDIADAVPAEDFKPYLHYYKGFEHHASKRGETIANAHVIKDSDLPIKIRNYNIYRLDLAYDNKGDQYLRFSTTFLGTIGMPVFVLEKGNFEIRQEGSFLRDTFDNDVRVRYVSISALAYAKQKKVDLKKVDFFAVPRDLDNAVLFKNKWRS